MSIIFYPDSYQKRNRLRVSLAKARAKVSVCTEITRRHNNYDTSYYPSIKQRAKSKLFVNHQTNKPYPSNVQFRVRFFGTLHHHVCHGPEKPAKRWKQANIRYEKLSHIRRISSRVYNRHDF